MDELKGLYSAMHREIVTTVGKFSLGMVNGISAIVAERDGDNKATGELPAVLPIDICRMNGSIGCREYVDSSIPLLTSFELGAGRRTARQDLP